MKISQLRLAILGLIALGITGCKDPSTNNGLTGIWDGACQSGSGGFERESREFAGSTMNIIKAKFSDSGCTAPDGEPVVTAYNFRIGELNPEEEGAYNFDWIAADGKINFDILYVDVSDIYFGTAPGDTHVDRPTSLDLNRPYRKRAETKPQE